MKAKGIIFALIAAAIGGAVSEATERGLNAADAKLAARKTAEEKETEETETSE